MKKILFHIQHQTFIGLALLYSFASVPVNPTTIAQAQNAPGDTTTLTQDSTDLTNPDNPENPQPNPNPESDLDPDEPDPPAEDFEFDSELIIKALNPGYTIDGVSNVGEFIELQNLTDAPLVLAGYSLLYVNSSGNTVTLYTFPDGSYMTGKHILLRYYKSPEHAQADDVYKGSGIAMKAGPLLLMRDDEVIDQVCWTNQADCLPDFKKDGKTTFRTTLVRNLSTGEFEHQKVATYSPSYDAKSPSLYLPPEPDEEPEDEEPISESLNSPQCRGLQFSELFTYYTDDKSEQFIELFNSSSSEIILDGCQIGYKNKTYSLSGSVGSGQYFAFYQSDYFALTKNPTNPLTLTLIDADDAVLDELAYTKGQKKGASYARTYDSAGNESWQLTYAITPNAENIYQKFRTCEEGKVINEATDNCVKVTSLKTTTSKSSGATSALAPCPAGKYRNPLTGRCKKIETASSSTSKECAAGYERNPETNRCRKIKTANDGAEHPLVPNTRSDPTTFIGIGVVSLIVGLGVIYITLQFRHEIARAARKTCQRFNRIRQDLFSRRIGRHRDKQP